MQLMTFNSLLMFDVVFVFFLFLVGVTCLVYYLPPTTSKASRRSHIQRAIEESDIECASNSGSIGSGCSRRDFDIDEGHPASIENEEEAHYYRQFTHRHHRCPHHHSHHQHLLQQQQQQLEHQEQNNHYHYDQQLHYNAFMNNRYMPVMSSSPSGSNSSLSGGGHFSRSYMPVPSTPPPPPPRVAPSVMDPASDGEDQGNMEILPAPRNSRRSSVPEKSSRHLYHNILNSAFEQHGDPFEDDDEYDMIATNVEILSSPVLTSHQVSDSNGEATPFSTSLPSSPDHNQQPQGSDPNRALDNQQSRTDNNNSNIRYHLPPNPRPECHSARHVVGICQYHMQQHLKSHHEQHQLHRLYQQQHLLQQFANQQLGQQQMPNSVQKDGSSHTSSPTSPTLSLRSLSTSLASIIQNPVSDDANQQIHAGGELTGGMGALQKKVQYMVVDTTTDRNKKPRPNKYFHVKAQNNCDMTRKCSAAAGPVDDV